MYTFDKINRYYNNEMNAEEKQDFELLLKTDKELQYEVDLYSKVHLVMRENSIKQTIKNIQKEVHKRNRIKKQIWVTVITTLLLIITFGVYRYSSTVSKSTPENLFNQQYAAYKQDKSDYIMGTQKDTTIKQMAEKAFREGNWSKLETLNQENKNNVTVCELLAIHYIDISDFDKADALLQNITDIKVQPIALWLRSGIAIKKNEKEKAVNLLQQIKDDGSRIANNAKSLLKELENH